MATIYLINGRKVIVKHTETEIITLLKETDTSVRGVWLIFIDEEDCTIILQAEHIIYFKGIE